MTNLGREPKNTATVEMYTYLNTINESNELYESVFAY